jgi:hypothetical protein
MAVDGKAAMGGRMFTGGITHDEEKKVDLPVADARLGVVALLK